MDSRTAIRPLERNPWADAHEGWSPLRHQIAIPEPVFAQEMETLARARFGNELDRLRPQTRVAIEDEVNDPLHWNARPNYHARGCSACAAP